jgi:RNA polymerase sigma-70 factor (ECF subfamily)
MSQFVAVTETPLQASQEIAPAVWKRARRGSDEAFAAIVQHYDPGLRALAFRLLGDRDRMDDVLQEAYLRAYRGLPRFRGRSKLGTWLYRIVYNACIDELRRAQAAPTTQFEDSDAWPENRVGIPERLEAASDLGAALAELDPRDRAAVLLVDAFGFDYREAARVLHVPEGTVASRLNRARGVLRRALRGPAGRSSERR